MLIPASPSHLLHSPLPQLLQDEIVDETDTFVDNLQTSRVNAAKQAGSLPPRLCAMLDRGAFTPRIGRLGMKVGQQIPVDCWACGPYEETQQVGGCRAEGQALEQLRRVWG